MRERKKDGDVQVIASTEYSTPLSNIRRGRALLVCFQGTSAIAIFEFVLCRGGQMQEKTRTFWPSQEYLQVLPLPKRAKPPANHSFKNSLTKATFLWINIKNRPQELDLKKNHNPAALNFLSLLDVVLNFDMKCIFLNWNLSLNYLWTMNCFRKNNCLLIARISAVVFVSEFP